ncbi:MAG: bifunctional 1-(5-phosphoribosyl)-5-((5-phosphoribosylamino)methylideneamino)imidazole-4-carboxamide isomerase/phosphoribosylanthranilate isomerase PriA [Cryobacterium sp.]|nr:bifunctional 1-(5-phosphoribosyl)-5-((5-phosphoribosylamino)methylideneamino)imidazole-4-carboxamide isomerase/phosphoribosylanthranilate isomerase PriA [Cryobacterium sp.]MBX3090748.1 bifunctional 1-(5-phosphoribosyl)-5-((5-phosphoribosylamino)methylideneamino)imidazole-4-carboxamide isomerase/phosphoribosylanthranilate isomerase PriA [Cryobacterium sp.]MCO5294138.1 bifunctional 1-(5-phosphoribosyl)-5-((5-phosphoribosylamino)methylideneamino)imidazole-4-carboxamide isomerase/phosphoribosylant
MSEFNTEPPLALLPAVDIAEGRAVRVSKGDVDSQQSFGDPIAIAQSWIDEGAEWIHLVDLDAAFGRGENSALIRKVIKQARGVNIELSGGIGDDKSLGLAMDSGAKRINLSTVALDNPGWTEHVIAEFGDAVAVALDVRGSKLAARGGSKEGGELFEVLAHLEEAGCSRYVVTDVSKDGTMQGPNLKLLEEIALRTEKPIIASGGISSLDDVAAIRQLVPLGIEGLIIGKALYKGAFTLPQALDVAGN